MFYISSQGADMNYKSKVISIISLTILLCGCVDADDSTTYKDIDLEQCISYTEEFKEYFKGKVSPIIEISENEVLEVPDMIESELTNELIRYSNIFSQCHIKQIHEDRDKGDNNNYRYHIIHRDLRSLIIFMGNIKEQSSSGSEMLSVLASFMKKNYIEIKKELDE